MSVELLDERREKRERGQDLEGRVSALENYIAMLIGTGEIMDGAITTSKLLNGCVEELKIAAGAVTAAKTAVAGIDSSTGNVTANHIIAAMIQTNAITSTKIYANAVTSDKINVATLSAISANMGTITAGSITSATVRTNNATYPHAIMNSVGFTVNGQYMTIRRSTGNYGGELYADSTYGLILSSFSGEQCFINGANNLVLNAGGGTLQLRHGNNTRAYTSSDSLIISSGMTLGGARRTTWPSGGVSDHGSLTGVTANQHHSSTSSGLNITPNSISCVNLTASSYIRLGSNDPLYWNGTSYYLKHDGTQFKINDDLQPHADGSKRLGYTNMAWYAVHSDNYLGCNLPASNLGIGIFKKIKNPKLKDGKAKGYHAGKRHYFEISEFPDEMKMTDKDSGKKDIELTRTLGVTVSAVRELVRIIDNLTNRLTKLERKTV